MEKALTEHFFSLLQFSCIAGALYRYWCSFTSPMTELIFPSEVFFVTEHLKMLPRCTKCLWWYGSKFLFNLFI